jgi:hypothetical protein
MIHRDIKPANIMLDVHGQAILMDFGIVKIVGATQHTATGAVIGTALYMPPELIRGEVPSPQSDIYSLGITLFEMVNGRPPFEADSAMTLMMMHLNDRLPDLRQLRPEVSEELIGVIEKALAKDPSARFGSMNEMSVALKGALERLQSSASPAATLVDGGTKTDSQPGAATIAAATGAAALSEPPALAPQPMKTQVELPSTQAAPGAAQAVTGPAPVSRPPTGEASRPVPPTSAQRVTQAGATGGGTPPPARTKAAVSGPAPSRKVKFALWGTIGGIVVGGFIIVLLAISIFVVMQMGKGRGTPTEAALLVSQTVQVVVPATATVTPSPSATPATTATITPTLPPTATPSPTLSPTPTIPVGVPYGRIKGITTDAQGAYVVDYETFEFTEVLPGMHVHFFFDTVPPEEAGSPGQGPWILYGGPRPFTKYRQADRPKHATQMCILVANPNHSVQALSGNCAILPDVVAASPVRDIPCLLGPAPEYPTVTQLKAGQVLQVRGLSADEGWWNVGNPQNMNESCWAAHSETLVSGDLSTLPLLEAPPLPTEPAAPALSAQITGITIDDQNRYVVAYQTQGFTEQLPGTHLHFFFNTVPAEQVGISGGGNRLMFGGPSPFTGYLTSARPAEATQLCVLVANPDHSIIPNSGNCFNLPNVSAP